MEFREALDQAEFPKTAIATALVLLDRIAYALEGVARELESR